MATRHRFKVAHLPAAGGTTYVDAATARHMRVLRLKVGEQVELFDGSGASADAVLCELMEDSGVCEAQTPSHSAQEPYALNLIQVLPKAAKIDQMVRMGTELGVRTFRLVLADFSANRPTAEAFAKRCARLERIAEEAARQSKRSITPEVLGLGALLEVAALAPDNATKVFFWERSQQSLERAVQSVSSMNPAHKALGSEDQTPTDSGSHPVWVIVGAEGGISAPEAKALLELGYRSATMGPSVLRVETAAPVACALVLSELRRRDTAAELDTRPSAAIP